jgi:HEAT repeat protein
MKKTKIIKSTIHHILILIVLIAALLSSNVFALNFLKGNLAKTPENETPEITIRNLAMGIETGNLGVRRSCIYFAGLYEIEKLVEPLVAQLTKEPDPNTRIFIALSLYKIGTKAAIIAVEDLVMNDVNPRVNK